jgi:ribosome-interacting GTPase 1
MCPGKGEVQKRLLEIELEAVGIRLNKRRPHIYFKVKKGGGMSINSTVTLTQMSEKMAQLILHEYSIPPPHTTPPPLPPHTHLHAGPMKELLF